MPDAAEHSGQYDVRACPWLELDSPITALEWVKMVVLMPLGLFRMLMVFLIWLVVAASGELACLGLPENEPLTGWRNVFIRYTYGFLCRFGLLVCGYLHIKLTGLEHVAEAKKHKAIAVINHVSYFDAPVLSSCIYCSAVAMSTVAQMPLIGSAGKALRFIWVERRAATGSMGDDETKSARQGVSGTQKIHMRAKDPRFPITWVAPEGTTTTGQQLVNFKTGAFTEGQAVLPVCLSFPYKRFNPAYTNCHGLWHFYRHMTQLVNFAEVKILPLCVPTQEEEDSPRLYADNVRSKMGTALKVPLVDQGLEEVRALQEAEIQVAWDGAKINGQVERLNELMADARRKREEKQNLNIIAEAMGVNHDGALQMPLETDKLASPSSDSRNYQTFSPLSQGEAWQ